MMERLWVALLAVGITALFSSDGIGGSVLHGNAGGPDYLQWIPPELFYANVHSQIALSKLQHGLRIDDELIIPDRTEQRWSQPAPVVEESHSELLPSALSGENLVETTTVEAITQEELFEALFGRQTRPSAGDNAIEDGGSLPARDSVMPPSEQSRIRVSSAAEDASSVNDSNGPSVVTQERGSSLLPGTKPKNSTTAVGAAAAVRIDAEDARLQMEAALVSGGETVKVTVGNTPKLDDISNADSNAELAASDTTRDSKHNILTNVNVNVNVNGDGTGSVINSTSVAEIATPIKTHHKKCD